MNAVPLPVAVARRYGGVPTRFLHVRVDGQSLEVIRRGVVAGRYPVSTAAAGLGERRDSLQTPRGWHIVRARIGAGAPPGAVFVGRRPTGEICTPELMASQPDRDWILTRILWLSGLEPGRNRLGPVDTMRRYIYIHGCPEGTPLGEPASQGCIRMANADVVELFDATPVGVPVYIG